MQQQKLLHASSPHLCQKVTLGQSYCRPSPSPLPSVPPSPAQLSARLSMPLRQRMPAQRPKTEQVEGYVPNPGWQPHVSRQRQRQHARDKKTATFPLKCEHCDLLASSDELQSSRRGERQWDRMGNSAMWGVANFYAWFANKLKEIQYTMPVAIIKRIMPVCSNFMIFLIGFHIYKVIIINRWGNISMYSCLSLCLLCLFVCISVSL